MLNSKKEFFAFRDIFAIFADALSLAIVISTNYNKDLTII